MINIGKVFIIFALWNNRQDIKMCQTYPCYSQTLEGFSLKPDVWISFLIIFSANIVVFTALIEH